MPGVAVTDTIKRVTRGGGFDARRVVETLPRDRLVAVQTPQAMRADWLLDAFATREAAVAPGGLPAAVTDDAQLLELAGYRVAVAEGEAGERQGHDARRPGPLRGDLVRTRRCGLSASGAASLRDATRRWSGNATVASQPNGLCVARFSGRRVKAFVKPSAEAGYADGFVATVNRVNPACGARPRSPARTASGFS